MNSSPLNIGITWDNMPATAAQTPAEEINIRLLAACKLVDFHFLRLLANEVSLNEFEREVWQQVRLAIEFSESPVYTAGS